jgi:hypothetical protein
MTGGFGHICAEQSDIIGSSDPLYPHDRVERR